MDGEVHAVFGNLLHDLDVNADDLVLVNELVGGKACLGVNDESFSLAGRKCKGG